MVNLTRVTKPKWTDTFDTITDAMEFILSTNPDGVSIDYNPELKTLVVFTFNFEANECTIYHLR